MRKLDRNDREFIIAFLGVSLIAAARFFDHAIQFHSAPMGIMQSYTFSQAAVSIYFFILFLFFGICLKCTSTESQKTIYILIVLQSIVAVPMYLHENYFGSMDVYAWVLLLAGILVLLAQRAEWITIPLAFGCTCICPMGLFYAVGPLAGILGYRAFTKQEKRYGVYALAALLFGFIGVGITKYMDFFTSDAQTIISFRRFALMLLLFSPYVAAVIAMWKKQIKGEDSSRKKAYLCLAFAVMPALIITLYLQDYARFFFLLFFYYTTVVLFLLAEKDYKIQLSLGELKDWIKENIPVPAVMIIYPAVIFTLWMFGPTELLVETLLGQ